jgi:hypothetical protein
MMQRILATTALATLVATGLHAQTDPAAGADPSGAAPTLEQGTGAESGMGAGEAVTPPAAGTTAQDGAATQDPAMAQDQVTDPAMQDPSVAQDDGSVAPPSTTEPSIAEGEGGTGTMGGTATGEGSLAGDEGMGGGMNADWSPVDIATISTDRLIGADIVTPNNETIATIEDVLISDDGQVENLVARFGGFLGFGSNRVLLTIDEVNVMQDANEALLVQTSLTPEAIEGRPEYEEEAATQ